MSGCSCYFSENVEKFEKEKYLFAAGLGGPGFISVNNKLVKLNLISSKQNPTNSGKYDRLDVYDSERYKVTVDINFKNTNGYETWWNDGTITIESKDGQEFTQKFVGECGC